VAIGDRSSKNEWNEQLLKTNHHIQLSEDEIEEETSKILVHDQNGEPVVTFDEADADQVPEVLPILPLRGVVVFPYTAVPLTIGQPRSIKLVDDVVAGNRLIGMVASKDPELETPGPEDMYSFGTLGAIQRLFRAPDGTIRLIVQGLGRIKIGEFTTLEPYLQAKINLHPEKVEESIEIEAQVRAARDQFRRMTELATSLPPEIVTSVLNLEDPLQVAYSIANFQRMDLVDAQAILEEDSALEKLQSLNTMLSREVEVLSLGQQIQQEARSEIEKVQREYFLREQLKAIQRELGEVDEQTAEAVEFRKRIDAAQMPEEAEKQARREVDRLEKLPTAAAEYGVIRTYLDWLVSLPWKASTEDILDLERSRAVLDEDHYGLEDVKERILEYLAVRKLRMERKDERPAPDVDQIRKEREGVILCFIGPPGVGKTSLGQSIARAMGRKFIRLSLGGVHDEAEIRGHRRTYIGAMPGRILQTIRRVESRNPVFMLDEVDKLGRDFRGDPASALLELLDPEQNREFRDNYLEVSFDMSQVMFITTGNWIDTIPAPLLDRMEVIRLSGYTEGEKLKIAVGYLIPRQIRENGLREEEITFQNDALSRVIRSYTREAGVRNLEREIGSICRKVATQIAEGKVENVEIDPDLVTEFLGKPRFFTNEEIAERTAMPGVAVGLAWTPTGGDVLFIEATSMQGGKNFQLTGSLGDVMQESARAALSYVRSISAEMKIADEYWAKHDIHLHIPAGAQPKDGPSAGVTMAVTLASLATGRAVRSDVAMTGEISLRGKVLPVGGIKEKVLAAHRSGIKTVILPKRNEIDIEEIPEEIRDEMKFVYTDSVKEVIQKALKPAPRGKTRKIAKPASRKKPVAAKAKNDKASTKRKGR
jgi:ATP-dependent Lon protease